MAVNPKSFASEAPPSFELKAAGFTLPVIRLLNANMEIVAEQLGAKVEQAPEFFHNTPVVIDLAAYPDEAGAVEFPLLVGLLRGYGMIPFGVRGGSKSQNTAAEALELAILGDPFARAARAAAALNGASPAREAVAAAPAVPPPGAGAPVVGQQGSSPSMLVTRPVRSGQSIYAAGGELSILGAVSSGAEVMADGSIHCYGPLRGRARAGERGNTEARIFCLDLQAELVAVAGYFRISENIPADLRGVPVQVHLEQKVLRIERI
jgi:septum site-determining protein MinC